MTTTQTPNERWGNPQPIPDAEQARSRGERPPSAVDAEAQAARRYAGNDAAHPQIPNPPGAPFDVEQIQPGRAEVDPDVLQCQREWAVQTKTNAPFPAGWSDRIRDAYARSTPSAPNDPRQ